MQIKNKVSSVSPINNGTAMENILTDKNKEELKVDQLSKETVEKLNQMETQKVKNWVEMGRIIFEYIETKKNKERK